MGDMRGAVVAVDTPSGGVLAAYSNPGYDPNKFVNGIVGDYALCEIRATRLCSTG